LSVPVQVIARKGPIICRAGRKMLLTHSLVNNCYPEAIVTMRFENSFTSKKNLAVNL